jgi:hypothetical protein
VLTRQVLYCLNYAFSLFVVVILEISSQFLPRLVWIMILLLMLPLVTGITGAHHHTQLFSFQMGLRNFFFFFSFCWPGTMILLISASHVAWNDRHMPPCPAIG